MGVALADPELREPLDGCLGAGEGEKREGALRGRLVEAALPHGQEIRRR